MNAQQTNRTVPAMPAAIKQHPSRMDRRTKPAVPAAMKKHPTLIMKTNIELQEEKEPGRYSIVNPGAY